ncbi:hypothetical protein [Frigoriglobus tundricola]|uniref:Uncharacterized protein n=1 Tax=Frigoriglobus tundricola TaxID=2774151 RepID=A0A6M5YZH2_9BACT|nr:hypothetical protein [Frigoriglobus tundricola]QJW98322.1 hypothetical protein FTUN_5910 [Frigoriglobus tundricola]
MAEPTQSPSLPSTADATPYVPVSWAAAAAAGVSVVFLLTLLVFGYFAYSNKKPLLMEELLVLPAVGIVLSFAARRMIRNSEGTRTGLLYGVDLVNGAWWASLVVGLCYVAYLFAIDFAIRRDARTEVDKWMADVTAGDVDGSTAAFWRMIDPRQRQSVSKTDRFGIRGLPGGRDGLVAFDNCDLMRLAQRNRGEFQYATVGVVWTYKPGVIDAQITGTVTCPEGTFPIAIPLKGVEGGVTGEGAAAGRQWAIIRPQSGGFFDSRGVTRTPYGWLVMYLEMDGAAFGKAFIAHLTAGPGAQAYAYRAFVAPGGDREGWGAVALDRNGLMQLAFAGPAGVASLLAGQPADAGYAAYTANQFYKLPGGAEPSAEQKEQFATSWNRLGIRPAGDKLKDQSGAIDKEDAIAVTDTAIEVRVPIEIPLLGKSEVARGRLVVACTDPALVAEMKQLRASADPKLATPSPTEDLSRRKVAWRVVRVESDLAPVSVAQPNPRGGPPGGGPGG